MFAVVTLRPVVDVIEHDDAGDEVHRLACGQEVQVGPTVPPPVTVAEHRVKVWICTCVLMSDLKPVVHGSLSDVIFY